MLATIKELRHGDPAVCRHCGWVTIKGLRLKGRLRDQCRRAVVRCRAPHYPTTFESPADGDGRVLAVALLIKTHISRDDIADRCL